MGTKLNLDLSSANGNISEFSKIPKGTYALSITDAEAKETKGGGNYYLALKLRVTKGAFEGRCIGHTINFMHQNKQAEEIGRDMIKQIMVQIGHNNPDFLGDTDELINGEFYADVDIESYLSSTGENRESSKIKRIVSKESKLVDGDESVNQSNTPTINKTQPSIPSFIQQKQNDAPVIKNPPIGSQPNEIPQSIGTPANVPPWMKK